MGTQLTAPELAEWSTALSSVALAQRTPLLQALEAAPAAGHALRYPEFVTAYSTGGLTDAELALQSATGLRAHDRRYIVRLYEQSTRMPDTSNAPVLTTRLCTAVGAAISRNDSPAQVAAVIGRTVTEAERAAEDIEGASAFCFALLKLKPDSSKLGKIAAAGAAAEDAEFVFSEKGVEIVTSEWKHRLASQEAWADYIREIKEVAREYSRFGLVMRITRWYDWQMESYDGTSESWQFVRMLTEDYMTKYRGRLVKAEDSDMFVKVFRKYTRQHGQLPLALLPPSPPSPPAPAPPPSPPPLPPPIEVPPPLLAPAAGVDTSRFNTLKSLVHDLSQQLKHLKLQMSSKPAPPATRPAALPAAAPAAAPKASRPRRKAPPAVPEPPPGPPGPSPPPPLTTAAPAVAPTRRAPNAKRQKRFEELKARSAERRTAQRAPAAAPAASEAARKATKRQRRAETNAPGHAPAAAATSRPSPPPQAETTTPAAPATRLAPVPEIAPNDSAPMPPPAAEAPAVGGTDARTPAAAATAAPVPPATDSPPAVPLSWANRTQTYRPPNDPRPIPAIPMIPRSVRVPGTGNGTAERR